MKIRSAEDFSDRISSDIAWRRKEVQTLLNYARSSNGRDQMSALRAILPILYSHWEGFIKTSAELYLVFIKSQKYLYKDLKDNFLAIKFYSALKSCEESNRIIFHQQIIQAIRSECNERANIPTENVIRTESNLSSEILRNILVTIGLESDLYELKNQLIDSKLIKIRNEIAHGEETYIDLSDYELLHTEIFNILSDFKNRLENMVITRSFISSV
ncbi:MAG: MAE_28990/MAE_18760 family HEPN-like nuclease [Ignavibacteriaceae bacterium]